MTDHIVEKKIKKLCTDKNIYYLGLRAAKRLRWARKIIGIKNQSHFKTDSRFREIVEKRLGKKGGFERTVIGKIEGKTKNKEEINTVLTIRESLLKYLPLFVEYYNLAPHYFLSENVTKHEFRTKLEYGWKLLTDDHLSALQNLGSIKSGEFNRHSTDFLIHYWHELVKIDAKGDTKTSVKCLLTNMTDHKIRKIGFPIYSAANVDISCWTSIKGERFNITPVYGKEAGEAVLIIHFDHWLYPKQKMWLKWGHNWPKAYAEGAEWWEFYLGRYHFQMNVTLHFDKVWEISNLMGRINKRELSSEPGALYLKKNTIFFKTTGPEPGSKIRFDFQLNKRILT